MGEIIEEVKCYSSHLGRRNASDRDEAENSSSDSDTVEITLKIIGPSPPIRLRLPSSIKVQNLRKLVSEQIHQPIEKLKIILRGNVLEDRKFDEIVQIRLHNRDTLMIAVKPKAPARHLGDDFDGEDDDTNFQLPQSAIRRKLYYVMREKLKLPDIVVKAILSITLKAFMLTILWFLLAPIAHKWNLGPLYILATGFSIIFINLGQRKDGELSAYSIFNEGFRELPGTINADRLDRDIRTGQM